MATIFSILSVGVITELIRYANYYSELPNYLNYFWRTIVEP